MSMFVRTNSTIWKSVNQSDYKDSIVFIEDTEQIYSNGVYYGASSNSLPLEKVVFTGENIVLEPDKFYVSDTILETLDITLNGDTTRMNTYFVEFLCDNTCVILPSNIKWKNNIVPDFTKTAIMTIKIQDDTAYLIDCRPLYSVQYTAAKKVQPNRIDAFGSEIIGVTEDKFILNSLATEIKENAFEGNQDLISITIPNTVKSIGSNAFFGCSNLRDIIEYEGYCNEWCGIELGEGWKENTNLIYVKCKDGDVYLGPYVTFTAKQYNGSIGLERLSTNQTLEYSTDTINWNTFDTTTNISLNKGDKVYVRGVLSADNTDSNYTQFKMSDKIVASGNCNAIWNYQDLNAPLKEYCGYYMFRNCSSLTTALELPATELAEGCYMGMFGYCTSLVTAPELPATTLVEDCYWSMFYNCSSLTTAPELPATTLAWRCYYFMFNGCTSLTTAPELPAMELADYCYSHMFCDCINLTSAPELPATTLAPYCYNGMFHGCTSLVTAPELPATTLAKSCYNNMFGSCASLVTVPKILPATTLARSCYSMMFDDCTSLTTAPELPATMLAERCYMDMFNNCTKLNHIKCLATNISASMCTYNWVYRVSSTGTFVKHPDMNNWSTGVNGIPSGWNIENAEL